MSEALQSPQFHADEFRSRGFSILRGLFTAEEAEEIRLSIEDAATRMPGAGPSTSGSMVFHVNCFRFSDRLRDLTADPKLVPYVRALAGDSYWIRWDQCVAKGPGAPEFPWHQDNAYNGLKDEHFQVWIALSPMTEDNGGVWLAPGSHRRGRLPHRREGAHHVFEGEIENEVLIDAQPGDVVLFSSLMLHRTRENRSSDARWAYVLEFMKGRDFDPVCQRPYLMVLERGKPTLRWTNWSPGRLHPANALKYGPWRVKRALRRLG